MSKLIRQDFEVACTAEQAFEFLSDLRYELAWNPGFCQSVHKVTDGPVGVGTRYRAKWKGSPELDIEYQEFDRPHTWRAHAGGSIETRFHATVEAHPEGARVVTELEMIPRGFFKLLFPIFELFFDDADEDVPGKIRRAIDAHYGEAKASA